VFVVFFLLKIVFVELKFLVEYIKYFFYYKFSCNVFSRNH